MRNEIGLSFETSLWLRRFKSIMCLWNTLSQTTDNLLQTHFKQLELIDDLIEVSSSSEKHFLPCHRKGFFISDYFGAFLLFISYVVKYDIDN